MNTRYQIVRAASSPRMFRILDRSTGKGLRVLYSSQNAARFGIKRLEDAERETNKMDCGSK